ncbi:hypothetical protein, partial [Burkholderia stabilis]|uniref:hypothetical protein n=1 Tax=Burkholderia stabilis TaxID=95485 RepID=UPI001C96B3E3
MTTASSFVSVWPLPEFSARLAFSPVSVSLLPSRICFAAFTVTPAFAPLAVNACFRSTLPFFDVSASALSLVQ